MRCNECGKTELVRAPVTLNGKRNGEVFAVRLVGWQCTACGFKTIDSKQSVVFTRLVSDAYRTRHGLLTGTEIQARRKTLGMSQSRFAQYLGVGVASIKRWEAGQIQDGAMDQLMRLKTDPNAARLNLDTIRSQHAQQVRGIAENEVRYDQPRNDFVAGSIGGFDKFFDGGSVLAA